MRHAGECAVAATSIRSACRVRTLQRFIERKDANLLPIFVDDADLRGANLAVGARTRRHLRTRIKWTSGNGLVLGEYVASLLLLRALVLHWGFGRGLGRLVATPLGHFRFLRFAKWICHWQVFPAVPPILR